MIAAPPRKQNGVSESSLGRRSVASFLLFSKTRPDQTSCYAVLLCLACVRICLLAFFWLFLCSMHGWSASQHSSA